MCYDPHFTEREMKTMMVMGRISDLPKIPRLEQMVRLITSFVSFEGWRVNHELHQAHPRVRSPHLWPRAIPVPLSHIAPDLKSIALGFIVFKGLLWLSGAKRPCELGRTGGGRQDEASRVGFSKMIQGPLLLL